MAQTGYEVLVPAYTVHQQVGVLTDPVSGAATGIQQGQGKTYRKGDLIPESQVSPIVLEALNDEDHPSHDYVAKRLKKTTRSATGKEVRSPFDGYDDLEEEQVLALLPNLPSATVTGIKEYEATLDDPRESILGYSVGYGESPLMRQTGAVNSGVQEGDHVEKRVADLKTREVPEEGPVTPGEGVTGTGDPLRPHFEEADSEGDDKPKGSRQRRGRRQRPAEGQSGSSGGDGDDKSGD